MSKIKIGDFTIGENSPCFIIAEAGVNHNGNIEIAKRLVEEAKKSGADCVKFQTYKSERVVTKNAPKADYQMLTTDPNESQIDMLKKLELPFNDYIELIQYCKKHQIIFLSTPYNVEDVDFLDDLGVPAFKLASIHAAEPSFANYVAKKGKPIILSTGLATIGEIDETLSAIHDAGNNDIILLQCTTNYPSRIEDSNILAMKTMKKTFNKNVGFSDHTQNDISAMVAIAFGAKVIEKHFTLDKNMSGPDQTSSADPRELSRLVNNIRDAEKALGSAQKTPCEIEINNSVGMRRSITTKQDIKKGTIINENMLTFKRPATGLKPSFINQIIGKKCRRDIDSDTFLQLSDIE